MKNNQTAEITGIVATALSVIIGSIVALNWWVILQIDGAASAALAGAFLMFEAYTVIMVFFNFFGLASEMVRAQIERFRFRDNMVQDEQLAQTAIMAARANKENASAELNQIRAMQIHMKQLESENQRLRNQSLESGYFSDGGMNTIEGVFSE